MTIDEPTTTPLRGDPQVVPGDKWIRGVLNGQVVVDSRDYLNVWEVPYWPWGSSERPTSPASWPNRPSRWEARDSPQGQLPTTSSVPASGSDTLLGPTPAIRFSVIG